MKLAEFSRAANEHKRSKNRAKLRADGYSGSCKSLLLVHLPAQVPAELHPLGHDSAEVRIPRKGALRNFLWSCRCHAVPREEAEVVVSTK